MGRQQYVRVLCHTLDDKWHVKQYHYTDDWAQALVILRTGPFTTEEQATVSATTEYKNCQLV